MKVKIWLDNTRRWSSSCIELPMQNTLLADVFSFLFSLQTCFITFVVLKSWNFGVCNCIITAVFMIFFIIAGHVYNSRYLEKLSSIPIKKRKRFKTKRMVKIYFSKIYRWWLFSWQWQQWHLYPSGQVPRSNWRNKTKATPKTM